MLISDPKERAKKAEEKRREVLRFLRDETWSVADVLARVVGVSSRQAIHKTLTQMERDELVKRHKLPIAGRVALTAWGITPHGLAFSWDEAEEYEDRPTFEPSRLSLSRIPHQIDLQQVRLSAEAEGWTDWVRGERLGFKPEIRPDAMAVRPDGLKVAIEVERTIKTRKRYQAIIRDHLVQMRQGQWQAVFYICPEGMPARLKKVFDSIEYVVIDGQRVPLEESHRKRFKFISLEEWPSMENAL
jgi:hypothetical protein